MGGRDTQVTVYVTEERKNELEERAAEAETSLSGIINDMLDKQLQREAQEAIASETRAEERIQELLTVGTEEMVETAREIREMNAKFGAYAIANFELMKRERSDHVRQDALKTGARRIRQDLDTGIHDLEARADPTATDGDSTTTAATTPAPSAMSDATAETSQQSSHGNDPNARQPGTETNRTETTTQAESPDGTESGSRTANETESGTDAEQRDEADTEQHDETDTEQYDEHGGTDDSAEAGSGSDLFERLRRGRK